MKNIRGLKVENMESVNGNTIANQFKIKVGNECYFQSYNTVMAIYNKDTGKLLLNNDEGNYTRTTAKYLTLFMKELGFDYNRKNIMAQLNLANIEDEFFSYNAD